jgi:hypothetical protein
MRKSELYDSTKYVVFFWDDVQNDFDDYLIDLVLDDLEKVDVLRICCFLDDVVEIDCDKRKKEEIDQTLNSCFFNENHNVVQTTKKRNDEFEKRWAILSSFDEFSRLLSIFDDAEHDVSMSDSKSLSNDSLFDDFRFFSDVKCLFCVDFLSDELVLKRFSNLICSSSCQMACLVEIENDTNRCLKLWSECADNFCYCSTDEFNVDVDLNCVEMLRRLIKEQIIENAFVFFHVQTISIESFEEKRLVDWNVQNRFDEKMIRVVIQI